jgi:hypothetical protein
MVSNVAKYKKGLESLIKRGDSLEFALEYQTDKDGFSHYADRHFGSGAADFIAALPNFTDTYQAWYSEAKTLIRQLLPDRVEDFARLYEKPKARKAVTYENYSIEDALQGLQVTRSIHGVVGPQSAIPRLRQQVAIVHAAKGRFESSLFDIRQLLQGDLFDSEIEAAEHLLKNNFARAAGALGGVVLERHLGEVCSTHNVTPRKKHLTVADLNQALKDAGVLETAQWRFIQHLGDLRNLCDHSKQVEPTVEQVRDLLTGTAKVTKTIF